MKRTIIFAFLLFFFANAIPAQDNDAAIQKAVETKNFIFKAESASPQRGSLRQLTSEYELVVRPDTIISFLPYFGRAFTAPIDPSEGGIKFTSVNYDYTVKNKKKHSWEIVIDPKDVSTTDIRNLYLTIFDNGRASLMVNSNNRETISFNGYIREGKPVDKKGF